ncbi:hypothetical protein [Parachlamydia sp. AcF125]|uniref:hypothetical protein n=1 Tax=Parachlamydia sp. AcF125 TaxID=2795736 RepID=UPI001BC97857|nr:hypothetical protein [Parachlamydia sp. AcF125]MBS4168056.1 Protein translocase subunit SecA [Parachlamydia sp. AcF125]
MNNIDFKLNLSSFSLAPASSPKQRQPIRQQIEFLKLKISQAEKYRVEELYQQTLEHIADFKEEDVKGLAPLLKASPHSIEFQRQLALSIGNLYISDKMLAERTFEERLIYYKQAMFYYAKAIQIAEMHGLSECKLRDCHQQASRLFICLIADIQGTNNAFYHRLDEARRKVKGDLEEFKKIYNQIKDFRGFCTSEEDYHNYVLNVFYHQVNLLLFDPHRSNMDLFLKMDGDFVQEIRSDQEGNFDINPHAIFLTQKYRKELNGIREQFNLRINEPIVRFQKNIFKLYKRLFNLILKDAFSILGPPPLQLVKFDIRAMGSIGRKEACPFSDLELMIFYKISPRDCENKEDSENILTYFKNLCHILDIQIRSLGETSKSCEESLTFSCIHTKNPSGFHMDSGPHADFDLLKTPGKMAEHRQKCRDYDPVSVSHMVLTSKSLYSSDAGSLFREYEEFLENSLSSKKKAAGFIKNRLESYKRLRLSDAYDNELTNIKNLYVSPLNYLLGDMALYLGIKSSNTLKIAQNLEKRFTEESCTLLFHGVEALYKIRCRLHKFYGEQKEEAIVFSRRYAPLPPSNLAHLDKDEVFELRKIRFLILEPLYALLENLYKASDLEQVVQSFEEKFTSIDLIQLAFDQILGHHHSEFGHKLAVEVFVSYLIEKDFSLDKHFVYYQSLSKRIDHAHLRGVYLSTLVSSCQHPPQSLRKLYFYPDPAGRRELESKQRHNFETQLKAIAISQTELKKDEINVCMESLLFNDVLFLKQEYVKELLDKQGYIRNRQTKVVLPNCSFYFKQQHPDLAMAFNPGKEKAVSLLLQRLFGLEMPFSEVLKFTVSAARGKPVSYLVQVSLAPRGCSLNEVEKKQLEALDSKNLSGLSELFLSLPLTLGQLKMEDCILTTLKDDNGEFMQQILPIANESAWCPPLIRKTEDQFEVKLFSILLYLFQDSKIHPQVIDRFLTLEPSILLKEWLKDLMIWNKAALSKKWDKAFPSCSDFCLFNQGTGFRLVKQFQRLHAFLQLRQKANKDVWAAEILKTIIHWENEEVVEIGDLIFNHYQTQKVKPLTAYEPTTTLLQEQVLSYQSIPPATRRQSFFPPAKMLGEIEEEERKNLEKMQTQQNDSSIVVLQGKKGVRLEKAFYQPKPGERGDLRTQSQILDNLLAIKHPYEKLNLAHCAALTDDKLGRFLVKSLQTLEFLDLRFCPQITDASLRHIAACSHLKELYISYGQIANFEETKKSFPLPRIPFISSNNPLIFPMLKKLEITFCPKLYSLYIRAEKLEDFVQHNNPRLTKALIESGYLPPKTVKEGKAKIQIKKIPLTQPEEVKGKAKNEIEEKEGEEVETNSLSIPSLPLEELLAELQQIERNIFEQIRSLKKAGVPLQIKEIEAFLPAKIKRDIFRFASENNVDTVECIERFCQYLRDMSQHQKEDKDPFVPSPSDYEYFVADTWNYSEFAALEGDLQSPPFISYHADSAIKKSLDQILSLIQEAKATMDKICGKEVISLLGNTGSGKSTTLNYLMGCEIVKCSLDENDLVIRLDAIDPVVKIGHDDQKSETEFPAAFNLQDLVFCDMPGYLETRGPEVAIAHAVNIKNILCKAASNRFLVLVNYHSLVGDKAGNVDNFLSFLQNLFAKKLDDISAGMLIGVTRVPEEIGIERIRNAFIKIAKANGWDLAPYRQNIVSIDPLNPSERLSLIEKLRACSSFSGKKGKYRTALALEEEKLISQIASEISKKVKAYWELDKVHEILKEYEILRDFQFIEHPSIEEAINSLQEEIKTKVEGFIKEIQVCAQIDKPEERVATIDKMHRLEKCCLLDACFNLEPNWVTLKFKEIEAAVQKIEEELQDKVNKRIEKDFLLLIDQLSRLLKSFVEKPRERKLLAAFECSPSDLMEKFFKQFTSRIIQDLCTLFDQVERETHLRPRKYYSGDRLSLKDLKRKKEADIHKLISSALTQAKISEWQASFDAAWTGLYGKQKALIEKEYVSLSAKRLTVKEFHLLAQYELVAEEVKCVLLAFEHLRSLDSSILHTCEERTATILNTLYENAFYLNKQKRVAELFSKIEEVLQKTPINELDQAQLRALNQCYKELADLDKEKFAQACERARKTFIEEPEKKLSSSLNKIPDQYKSHIETLLKTISCIQYLSACFGHKEIVSVIERSQSTVRAEEARRREIDVAYFQRVIPQKLEEAKAHVNVYAKLNFARVVALNLKPEEVEDCLKKLQPILPELSSFLKERSKLHRAIENEAIYYYYKVDGKIKEIQEGCDEELTRYFKHIDNYAEALVRQKEINGFLNRLQEEAKKIAETQPELLLKHKFTVKAGFPEEIVTGLKAARHGMKILALLDVEVSSIFEQTKHHIQTVQAALLIAAQKKEVEAITKRIEEICASRDFLSNIERIQKDLSVLKHKSPESYKQAISNLLIHITAWINAQEHINALERGDYRNVATTFITIQTLHAQLKGHMEIDSREFAQKFGEHIDGLLAKALQEINCEINCDTTNQSFFQIKHLRDFLEVIRTFSNLDIKLSKLEEQLKEAARKQWPFSKWEQLFKLTIGERDTERIKLTQVIVKQYLIARELSSLFEEFKRELQEMLDAFPVHGEIDKLGCQISALSSITSAAEEIIAACPHFRVINTKLFNKKAKGITYKNALERLAYDFPLVDHPVDVVSKNKLLECYKTFKKCYNALLTTLQTKKQNFDEKFLIKEIRDLSQFLSPYATVLYKKPKEAAELLANIFALWTYVNAPKNRDPVYDDIDALLRPHKTQLLTIFRLVGLDGSKELENQLAEVKTGEGKSISLGILATLFALLGYKVNVICYSSYLSERDYKAFSTLFEKLWPSTSFPNPPISYSTITQLANKLMHSESLPDYRKIVRNFFQVDRESMSRFKPEKESKSLLLIDEVDVFFGESFYGRSHCPAIALSCEDLFYKVWERKDVLLALPAEEAIDQLIASAEVQNLTKRYRLQSLLKNEIAKMLKELRHFPGDENHTKYVVQNDQVGVVDHAGNLCFNMVGYDVSFAYLYWHKKGEIHTDTYLKKNLAMHITSGFVLYSQLPDFFSLKLGLTATLGALSEEEKSILKKYEFNRSSFIPSTFNKKEPVREETLHYSDEKKYFEAIREEINNKLREERACFVVMKETKDVEKFNKYLSTIPVASTHFTAPELLTEMVPDEEKGAIIARATSQYKIVLMTRSYGRGIDFICRDTALLAKGGIHIILAFSPETLTEEIQIEGRTCRQDNPGSIRKILLTDDLFKHGFFSSKDELAGIEDLDSYLNTKRQEFNSKRFQKMQNNLENSQIKHDKSLGLVKNIEESQDDLAYSILQEFNG